MEDNPLYTAENKLLNLKFELNEISDKLHHLSSGIYNGMSDSSASTEAGDLSREVSKLAKSINLSITE